MNRTVTATSIRPRLLASMFALLAVLTIAFAVWLVGGTNAQLPAAAAEDADDEETLADEPVDPEAVVPLSIVDATTHDTYLARDPFHRLIPMPEDVEATAATDGGGTSDGGDTSGDGDTDGSEDGDGATPIGSDGEASGTCTNQTELVCNGTVVTLQQVREVDGEQVAFIQVHTEVHEVREGERFAGAFQLRSIDGDCVNLLYGDEAFSLCEGGRAMK
jgi:hypothetical protein